MARKKLAFQNNFTAKSLFFSWQIIKSDLAMLNWLNITRFPPISRTWFKRTSFLLRSGNYKYHSINRYIVKKNSSLKNLRLIKSLIIQISFVNGLIPFFKGKNSSDLTQYLWAELITF